MPIIIKGKITNLSEKPVSVPKTEPKPVPKPTVTKTDTDNEYLKKRESAKHSFFNTTIEGEKPNWTKSDYLVDILSDQENKE